MASQERNLADKSINNEGEGIQATGGNAEIHDRTGLYIAIIAFGVSCLSLGISLVTSAVTYAQRIQEAQHVALLDDAYQRWKMWAETHGFPEPEKRK